MPHKDIQRQREYDREFYNKEKIKIENRKYREKNKEKIKIKRKKYIEK